MNTFLFLGGSSLGTSSLGTKTKKNRASCRMGQTCFSIILNYMKIYVHIPKSVNPHLFVIDVGDIGPCNL